MVIHTVAISTKTGKPVLARNFVPMRRMKVEGMLSAFPKLISSQKNSSTFIELDNMRYVYQPMEGVYLILITTTNSNIVEDLETLHHLCKTVKDICEVVSEKEVYDNFDSILFAIDEMILPSEDLGGFSEGLTPHQIFTLLEMESVEENLQDIIKQQREAEAKQEAKRKAFEIAQRKAQNVVENLSKGMAQDQSGVGNLGHSFANLIGSFGKKSIEPFGGGIGSSQFTAQPTEVSFSSLNDSNPENGPRIGKMPSEKYSDGKDSNETEKISSKKDKSSSKKGSGSKKGETDSISASPSAAGASAKQPAVMLLQMSKKSQTSTNNSLYKQIITQKDEEEEENEENEEEQENEENEPKEVEEEEKEESEEEEKTSKKKISSEKKKKEKTSSKKKKEESEDEEEEQKKSEDEEKEESEEEEKPKKKLKKKTSKKAKKVESEEEEPEEEEQSEEEEKRPKKKDTKKVKK